MIQNSLNMYCTHKYLSYRAPNNTIYENLHLDTPPLTADVILLWSKMQHICTIQMSIDLKPVSTKFMPGSM